MPSQDLYVVLGISPWANQEAIRSAYRALAKRYHPDRVGPTRSSRFREVNQAYRVLSDSEGRRTHDRELDRVAAEPSDAEPLAGRPAAEPLRAEGLSWRSFRLLRPSRDDEFLDWTARHLTERHLPKSGRRRPIDVEVVLSRDEAVRGGILPIQIPAVSSCPLCGGTGRDWSALCGHCGGEGAVEEPRRLALRIPRFVRDGTVWATPLLDTGLDLCIQVRIDPSSW